MSHRGEPPVSLPCRIVELAENLNLLPEVLQIYRPDPNPPSSGLFRSPQDRKGGLGPNLERVGQEVLCLSATVRLQETRVGSGIVGHEEGGGRGEAVDEKAAGGVHGGVDRSADRPHSPLLQEVSSRFEKPLGDGCVVYTFKEAKEPKWFVMGFEKLVV